MKQKYITIFSVILIFANFSNAKGDEKTIEGKNFKWVPKEVKVKSGDIITWKVTEGSHGLMFNNYQAALRAMEVQPGGMTIDKRDPYADPAKGTVSTDSSTPFLVKIKIKDHIPSDVTEIPFFCTAHGDGADGMPGKLILQTPSPTPK